MDNEKPRKSVIEKVLEIICPVPPRKGNCEACHTNVNSIHKCKEKALTIILAVKGAE